MKKVIGISTIILLVLLILFPPYLRRFVTFDTKKVETVGKNDTINVLNCKNSDSEINTSYLNGNTYNIQYKISGNYLEVKEEIEEEQVAKEENAIIDNLKDLAKVNYDAKKDQTIYKLAITDSIAKEASLTNYLLTIQEQIKYYESNGYKCSSLNL